MDSEGVALRRQGPAGLSCSDMSAGLSPSPSHFKLWVLLLGEYRPQPAGMSVPRTSSLGHLQSQARDSPLRPSQCPAAVKKKK